MSRRLRHDPFLRQRSKPLTRSARERRAGGALVALALVSMTLMTLSRLDHRWVRSVRQAVTDAATPVLAGLMVPLSPLRRGAQRMTHLLDAQAEAERLRDENARLKSWESRARELERRLASVERIARVVPDQSLSFVTARVIADAIGPFVRSALIDAGRDSGLRSGYPVLALEGLVGRLVATGHRSSRLLLLTDLNSRVPVSVGAKDVRAVMQGDNGPFPRLAHLPADAGVEVGDEVRTSGVGGLFPRGLTIGTVVDGGDALRVVLHVRLDRLEYVSVLFFDSPGVDFGVEGQTPRVARRPQEPEPGEKGGSPW